MRLFFNPASLRPVLAIFTDFCVGVPPSTLKFITTRGTSSDYYLFSTSNYLHCVELSYFYISVKNDNGRLTGCDMVWTLTRLFTEIHFNPGLVYVGSVIGKVAMGHDSLQDLRPFFMN
jgi:hypothetical protein